MDKNFEQTKVHFNAMLEHIEMIHKNYRGGGLLVDESMWSEFEGLWGMGIEELEDIDNDDEDGVLHRGPNFEDEGGEPWQE